MDTGIDFLCLLQKFANLRNARIKRLAQFSCTVVVVLAEAVLHYCHGFYLSWQGSLFCIRTQ